MTIGVAVVGAGYWGKNIVRTMAVHPRVRLVAVCDASPEVRGRMAKDYPGVDFVDSLDAVLARTDVDAVCLATPAIQHAPQAVKCLRAGRHVLCEKPLAVTIDSARQVVDEAERSGKVMMVGHLLAYHPAMSYLRDLVQRGDLGTLYYLYSQRVNLGRIRTDESALWSFGPHDLTMILDLVGAEPDTVSAHGRAFLRPNTEDVVFMHLDFREGPIAQVQMSWLDPHKERRLTVVGSKKMAVFDDAHPTEKIRIYDKGYDRPPDYGSFADFLSLRDGDILIPRLPLEEPLRLEVEHFVQCLETGARPRTDATAGYRIVRILAAAEASLRHQGTAQVVSP